MSVIRLFLLLILTVSVNAQARPTWGLGLGFESRFAQAANPEEDKLEGVEQLYGKIGFDRIAIVLELGLQNTESSASGSYSVNSQSYVLTTWGRYTVVKTERFVPFVGLGAGTHFDKVTTRFEGAEDIRVGRRSLVGLTAGAGFPVWKRLETEAEARANFIEETPEPVLSLFCYASAYGFRWQYD